MRESQSDQQRADFPAFSGCMTYQRRPKWTRASLSEKTDKEDRQPSNLFFVVLYIEIQPTSERPGLWFNRKKFLEEAREHGKPKRLLA